MSIKSYKAILDESMKEYEVITGFKCDLTKDYCSKFVKQLCKKNLEKDRKLQESKYTFKSYLSDIPLTFNNNSFVSNSFQNPYSLKPNNWYNTNKYLSNNKYSNKIVPNYTPIDIHKINCPVCHKLNFVDTNKKLFGLSEKCKVCHDNPINVYLPDCGHACLCSECFNEIKN